MTPAKLAWLLSLSAIVLLVIVSGLKYNQPYNGSQPSQPESRPSESYSEDATRFSGGGSELPEDGVGGNTQTELLEETPAALDNDPDDEARVLESVRMSAIKGTQERYSILIEKLGLTQSEKDALFEFIVEDTIARTKSKYSNGDGMGEEERLARLRELLPNEKLQQFLQYEKNRMDLRELYYVQSMLQQKGAPLTAAQRDSMLEILIDVRLQLDPTPSHMESGSTEAFEHTLGQLDEYDRLVTELASSVLTGKQIEYVFERNQKYSYQRARQLELHKQKTAVDPDDDSFLWYIPKGE